MGGIIGHVNAGRVATLEREVLHEPVQAHVGIRHTRWATHGRGADQPRTLARSVTVERGAA